MDVISLLNTASAVRKEEQHGRKPTGPEGQTLPSSTPDERTAPSSVVYSPYTEKSLSRRTSESKTPVRNRTPWDANGYALPLTMNAKSAEVSVQPILCGDSPVESVSPKSPRHKFSDSHSSLSSYSSSSASLSHSRISSMSTAGSLQAMGTIPDVSSLEIGSGSVDPGAPKGRLIEHMIRRGGILSPSAIAEEPSGIGIRRPGSPSDAMLMLRASHNLGRMSPPDISSTKHLNSDTTYLVPPDLSRAHKRAISAPDFAAINSDRTFLPLLTTFQPTPPPSHQGDRRPSYAMDTSSASPVNDGPSTQSDSLVCMYVDNCDTNSALRKAISHIFGRNKLCTRMIPQHVWVHFCRKHYQRSRYRNAQEYAKLQCDLVQKQVRRVQNWSDENQRTGQAGILQDWSLSMRKREQNRVQDKSNKKRPFRDESGEEDEEDDAPDRAVLNGTAVPDWLRNKCSSGYTTSEIEEIVTRLKGEMDANNLTQIPDIEILPSISTDTADDQKPKVVIRRKTSAGSAHRRSQSVGMASQAKSSPMARRTSQPSEDNSRPSPVEKRQRISETYPLSDNHHGRMLARLAENAVPAVRPLYQLPHRPAFQHIHENRAEEAYFDEQEGRGPHYNHNGPLPAPTPQRLNGEHTASHLESATSYPYLDNRRPQHNRSHSEMGSFQGASFGFQETSSPHYHPRPQDYPRETTSYGRGYMPRDPMFASNGPQPYYDEQPSPALRNFAPSVDWPSVAMHSSTYAGPRHSRHSSTPNVPHISIPRHEYDHSSPRSSVLYESPTPYHRRQHSYASPRQFNHRPVIQETEQAKAVYGARR